MSRLSRGMAFSFFPFHFISKFPPRWAWLGGHPGVWMQFHVRSILAPGTAPGRMACSSLREHGKNRSLPAEEERLRKLGVQGPPAVIRRVAFIGGSAPSRPKSRPGGRLASKRFAAARSKDTTFSRLTARKCCCHPRRGKRQKACALPPFCGTCACTVLRRILMIPAGQTAGGDPLGQTTQLGAR